MLDVFFCLGGSIGLCILKGPEEVGEAESELTMMQGKELLETVINIVTEEDARGRLR